MKHVVTTEPLSKNFMRNLLFALIFLAAPALADRYEHDILLKHKAWTVQLVFDTQDSQFWCTAETKNRSKQTFTVAVFPNNGLTVFVFDPRWDLKSRPIDFILDVDYSRWEIQGQGDGIGLSVSLEPGEKVGRFISQVASGNAVALYNTDERRLATFSLAGSKASLLKLSECWRAIKHDQSDPFQSSSDPF